MKKFTLLILAIPWLAVGCSDLIGTTSVEESTGTLSGTVIDSDTLNFIKDVEVSVRTKTDVSDINGRYRIEELDVGTRGVVAKKDGYKNYV